MKCCDFIKNASDRIVIRSQDNASDGYGGFSTIWTTVGTYWAWIKPVSIYEKFQNEQLQSRVTHKIIIRHNSAFENTRDFGAYSITFDGRVYSILGIKNFDKTLKNYGRDFQELSVVDNGAEIEDESIPNDIGGLVLSLDPSDLSTITESGGSVSQCDDKSGNGNHATQGTSTNQPSTGVNTIGGRNVITFDGVNDALVVSASNSINNIWAGGGTAFYVYTNTGVTGRVADKAGSSGDGWRQYHSDDGGTSQDVLFQHTATTTYGTITDDKVNQDATPIILGVSYDKDNPGTLANIYADSTSAVGVSIQGSGSGSAGDDSSEDLYIGNIDALDRPLNGDLAQILLYDRALSSIEITKVMTALANKWGVTLT